MTQRSAEVRRRPEIATVGATAGPVVLSEAQRGCVEALVASLDGEGTAGAPPARGHRVREDRGYLAAIEAALEGAAGRSCLFPRSG